MHVRGLAAAEKTDLASLSGAPLVAVSSVQYERLTGYEGARFEATLAATDAYREAGVPQLVMFGERSHYQVPQELARRGAVVVPTPRPGLATPYLDAAHLVRLHAGVQANVLKAEGDKLITAEALSAIEAALHTYGVVVGDRSTYGLESMTPIQHRTEAIIDAILAGLLDIPHGASSGVQAYTPEGLRVFLEYEGLLDTLGNNWKYLVYVPAQAGNQGISVGSVELDLVYDAEMVKAEDTESLTLKRLEQLLLMLEGGFEVCGLIFNDGALYRPPSEDRLAAANAMMASLRTLVAG
jgi:hypothetical protein